MSAENLLQCVKTSIKNVNAKKTSFYRKVA